MISYVYSFCFRGRTLISSLVNGWWEVAMLTMFLRMDLVSLMMTPVVQMTSAKTFHSRGELWGSELSSRLANESGEPRETTVTEYVRTVRLQSKKLWQWIKKPESSSHFDSNSDLISSEDPKIGYWRCCMRSQSSKEKSLQNRLERCLNDVPPRDHNMLDDQHVSCMNNSLS